MSNSQKISIFSFIFLASAALHFSMFATGYMQEDAFITFRTSFNFADYGVYSFNLDEDYPGATSLFFGFFVAIVRFLFAEYAIPMISLINICLVLFGGYFLFLSIRKSWLLTHLNRNTSLAIVLLAATASPALLKISSSGMETSSLFMVFCLTLWALANEKIIILCFLLILLPFIRIDSTGFSCILLICLFFSSKRKALVSALAFTIGLGLLLLCNTLVFDAFLPLTAEAKAIAYSPDKSIEAIIYRYLHHMFASSFLLGVQTKYIHTLAYICTAVMFLYPVIYAIQHFYKRIRFDYLLNITAETKPTEKLTIPAQDLPVYVIAFASILVPLAYAWGGVVFPWYLWPYSSLAFVLLIGFLVSKVEHLIIELISLVFIGSLAGLTLFININISEQENRFRASIGHYIKQISMPSNTLFLEPAGYIPFFAGVKTFDTIGLASPRILHYRKNNQNQWWINFVKNENPSFIVDRLPVHISKSTGDGGYKLSDEEYDWFINNYVLEASFNYKEYLERNKTFMYSIYNLGGTSDYFLYKKYNNTQ